MATKERINYKVDWDTLTKLEINGEADYDKETDTFFVQSKEDRLAVSVDCGGEVWVRVDPQSGEIIGIEIENVKAFMKAHRRLFEAKNQDAYIRPVIEAIRLEKCPA